MGPTGVKAFYSTGEFDSWADRKGLTPEEMECQPIRKAIYCTNVAHPFETTEFRTHSPSFKLGTASSPPFQGAAKEQSAAIAVKLSTANTKVTVMENREA